MKLSPSIIVKSGLLVLISSVILMMLTINLSAQSRWTEDFADFDEDGYYIGGMAYWEEDDENFILTGLQTYITGRIFCLQQFSSAIFTADFDIRIGGGNGADGITFAWVEEYDYPEHFGIDMDFQEAEGYAIEFDCYTNQNYGDPNGQHIALIEDGADNHLAIWQTNEGEIEDNQWHHVRVLNFIGEVQVFWDDERIIEHEIEDYEPFPCYFGFTSGTGAAYNWHVVDNISIAVGGPTMELSDGFIEFGPVPSGDEALRQIQMSNVSEDQDEWHVLDFTITDLGGEPNWLAVNPSEGSVEAGESIDISFTATTEGLELGEYDRTVRIETNDPDNLTVEVDLHIFIVEGFGLLFGTVTDADDNRPLEGATVMVDYFGFESITDADGNFEFPDIPSWTYDILVTMPDYLPLWDREVIVDSGDEVRRDYRLLHAVFDPDPLRVEASMQPDDELEQPLRIHNDGNGTLTWSVEKVFPEGGDIDPWVFRGGFAAGDSVGDNRMAGVEFVNGRFYLAGGTDRADLSMIYIFDRNGNYLDQFPQFAESRYGMRDLAFDGRLLWGIDGNTIYGFTTDGELERELESPVNSARYIAYDPDRDALWVSSVTTNIEGITLDGEEVGELNRPPDTHIYGLGWFPEDEDGYYLYVFTNDGDYHQQVHKINPATDESMYVRDLMDVEGARAGGVVISGTWDPYCWVFMSMLDSPDMVAIWQLAPRTNWLDVAPIAGVVEPDGEVELTVTLNSLGLPVDEEFEADLVFTHDGIHSETIVPVSVLITDVGGVSQRIIRLDLGWNMVSSNVIPMEDSIEVIMRPLVEEDLLLLMKDGNGHFYMPAFHYNDIPGWNVAEGYQVKVAEDCEVVIEGEVVVWDTPIELQDGWQIVSYYPRDPVDAMIALAGIEEQLLIAKDGWGHFYIPAFGFSDIGDMREGQGYQVKLQGDGQLIYRLDEEAAGRYIETPNGLTHFNAVAPTGSNMSLLVLTEPSFDGEIGVYADDLLVGAGVAKNGRCGIAVWGDDPTTNEVDGMLPGETIQLVIFRNAKEQKASYASLVGQNLYATDDTWVVRIDDSSLLPTETGIISAYPNPFNSSVRLTYGLASASVVIISLYDISGRCVMEFDYGQTSVGIHAVVLDGTELCSGVYFAGLKTADEKVFSKLTLIK